MIVEKRGRKREEEKEKRKKVGVALYIDYITFVAPIYRLYIVYITFITFSVFPQPFCAPSIVQSHLHFFHNYSHTPWGLRPPFAQLPSALRAPRSLARHPPDQHTPGAYAPTWSRCARHSPSRRRASRDRSIGWNQRLKFQNPPNIY